MISIDDNNYEAIARELMAAIGSAEYYNGTVCHETGQFTTSLRTTLIIYREPSLDPADNSQAATRITHIVPVWWEFHTVGESGEIPNNFGWKELEKFLL